MKKKNIRRAVSGLFFLLLLTVFLFRAGYVLLPERTDFGSCWPMFEKEPKNSVDVLFLGSSVAYCDVIPAVFYEETGLTAYVLAGPEQTLSVTLDYLREALRTQKPSLVCLEVSGMLFDRYMGYTRVNIGYMPLLSANRLDAVLRAAEPEARAGLLFPLYDYHDLWAGLPMLFSPRPDERTDPWAGYTRMDTSEPQTGVRTREDTASDETFAENAESLRAIIGLCRKAGTELVLYEAPGFAPIPEDRMAEIREAAGEGTPILDCQAAFSDMGLDPETDFHDFLHLNFTGAEKFTRYLAVELLRDRTLRPCPHDEALWRQRTALLREEDGGETA